MHFIPGSIQDGIVMASAGCAPLRVDAELWNRDSSDCGAGEVMAFNEDGANATYVGIDPLDPSTFEYGSVFKCTVANIIGAVAMALETVKAGKKGRYLIYGYTTILKYATISGNLARGYELTLETTADGSSAAVSNVSSSAGSSLVARPRTGTNGFDAYTVPIRCFGKSKAVDASTPTAVSARSALFNGCGYQVGYGG